MHGAAEVKRQQRLVGKLFTFGDPGRLERNLPVAGVSL
jgi:hypothetical protein